MEKIQYLENLIVNTRHMRNGSQALLAIIADILLEILREMKDKKEIK